MGWSRRHVATVSAVVLAAAAGVGVGFALAGTGHDSRTRTRVIDGTRTVLQVRTVKTATAPATASTSPARRRTARRAPPATRRPAAAPKPQPARAQVFSGTGPTSLGTVTIPAATMLRWTNSRGRFRVIFDGVAVGVNSTARAGRTSAPARTYREVRVDTPGSWTIRIG